MGIPKMIGAALALVVAALHPSVSSASEVDGIQCHVASPDQTAEMVFRVASDGGMSWIVAEGRIAEGSAAAFDAFLRGLPSPPKDIVLSSVGGLLREGLALGHAIRGAGLSTHIGQTRVAGSCTTGASVSAGLCASACAYAFLGGVSRHVDSAAFGAPGSAIGFHQVHAAPGQTAVTPAQIDHARRTARAQLAVYAQDMGADPRLPELVAHVPADTLFVPPQALRDHLGIELGAEDQIALDARPPARLF